MSEQINVLLVEDDQFFATPLKRALLESGFSVSLVENGEAAVEFLKQNGAAYSALITDVNFPGALTGWDVAKHARELNETLPIIYMTGASAHQWVDHGVANSQLLSKPFKPGQAVTAVAQIISGRMAGQPVVTSCPGGKAGEAMVEPAGQWAIC